MLFGIVFFSHQIGSFLGSWLGGRFFDIYGSYNIMWWACVVLGFLSALVHMPIKEIAVQRLVRQN
ncbi:MAG: MFS transporter, partial [Pelagibacterales bacterium]|nr:MFS transporter [Pelagibacterales bacterium]